MSLWEYIISDTFSYKRFGKKKRLQWLFKEALCLSSLINEGLFYFCRGLSLHYSRHSIIRTSERSCFMMRSQIITQAEEAPPSSPTGWICQWPNIGHRCWSLQPLSLRWNNLQLLNAPVLLPSSPGYFGELVLPEKCNPPHPDHTFHTSSLLLMRVIELII